MSFDISCYLKQGKAIFKNGWTYHLFVFLAFKNCNAIYLSCIQTEFLVGAKSCTVCNVMISIWILSIVSVQFSIAYDFVVGSSI